MEGRLTYRKWQTESREERIKAEIHLDRFNSEMKLMDSKSDGVPISAPTTEQPKEMADIGEIIDDDIPL